MTFTLSQKTLLFSSIFILNFKASILAQKKINLQEAVQIALSDNPQVRQAVLSESLAKLDLIQAKKAIYPTLNANTASDISFARTVNPLTNLVDANNSYTFNSQLNANVSLFQGFQKMDQIKRNKYLLDASDSDLQKLKNDIKLNVISTYLTILNYQDQLLASKDQLILATQTFENEIKSFKAGKKLRSDTSRAKSQLLKTEVDGVTIKNQLDNSLIELQQLLNLAPGTNLTLSKPTDGEGMENSKKEVIDIYNSALNIMPEIRKVKNEMDASKLAVLIAKSAFYPSINMSAVGATNYIYQPQTSNSLFITTYPPFFNQLHSNLYEYVSLNIAIPIFNNGINRIAVSKAKIDLENEHINLNIAKNTLYKVINQAKADFDAAEKNYYFSKQSYISAKETFNTINKRYNGGLSSSLDFTQAQTDMNNAQFTLIRNKYEYLFRSKVIDFYLGKDIAF